MATPTLGKCNLWSTDIIKLLATAIWYPLLCQERHRTLYILRATGGLREVKSHAAQGPVFYE